MIEQAGWSLGTLLGVPLTAVALLIVLAVMAGGIRYAHTHSDGEGGWFLAVIAGVVSLVIIVGFVFAFFPFHSEYHRYYKVTGTITSIGVRQVSDSGGGFHQRYVFKLKELPSAYAIDDSRASVKKAGDPADLLCKKDYEFRSVPGWLCRWNEQ